MHVRPQRSDASIDPARLNRYTSVSDDGADLGVRRTAESTNQLVAFCGELMTRENLIAIETASIKAALLRALQDRIALRSTRTCVYWP